MDGIVLSLGIVGNFDGLVGSDVRIAEKIAGRHDDVTEDGDVVDGS
jgi:hypothetical protein